MNLCLALFIFMALLHKCVEENAHSTLDQQEYQQRYTSLAERYEAAKDGLRQMDDKRLERNAKRETIGTFIRMLEQSDKLLNEFDEGLWTATVDMVTVHSEHEITFTFKDGLELGWNIKDARRADLYWSCGFLYGCNFTHFVSKNNQIMRILLIVF